MRDLYILYGHDAVPCEDINRWGDWMENSSRRIADETVGPSRISTVFLGIDHQFGRGRPLLFETMVFGGPLDQEQERCSTWEEAEHMHAVMVMRVKGEIQ